MRISKSRDKGRDQAIGTSSLPASSAEVSLAWNEKGNLYETALGVHPDRVARSDSDHRHPCGDPVLGLRPGAREGAQRRLSFEPETGGHGDPNVHLLYRRRREPGDLEPAAARL